MSIMRNEPIINNINKIAKPKTSSYDKNWAIARTEPKNAYFELLDQPAKITLYTLNELKTKKNNKLYFESKIENWKDKGITAHKEKLRVIINTGENKKI